MCRVFVVIGWLLVVFGYGGVDLEVCCEGKGKGVW